MYNLSAFPPELKKNISSVLGKTVATPAIICSKKQIAYNLNYFLKCLSIKAQQVYFPVKANHDNEVLEFLGQQNTSFEVASLGELLLLKKLNIDASRIIFSNPVKLPDHIKKAYEYGVRTFAFDSKSELKKIAELAPGSNVCLRIAVSNSGAEWKL